MEDYFWCETTQSRLVFCSEDVCGGNTDLETSDQDFTDS